jgi:phosphatidylserine decarboxylase
LFVNDRLFIATLHLLPKNAWSRFIGAVAHAKLPRFVARPSVRWFARRYNIDVSEAELPIREYRSVGDFFTRRLKLGARNIDRRPGYAVSPADGRVLNSGSIEDGRIIQAKGRDFTVAQLLKDDVAADRFLGGSWVTIYLSPRDYHRVHHPVEGTIRIAHHIPGYLWPVNQAAVENVDELFAVNERIVTYVDSPIGEVATVMVGATSVGHISMAYDDDLHSNQGEDKGIRHFPDPIRVARGDELGTFHLGSTAVVLFANPNIRLETLEEGQVIKMGEAMTLKTVD